MDWINDPEEYIAVIGWVTLGCLATLTPDDELDINSFRSLLSKIEKEIHTSPNRVRGAMNNFLISVGAYIKPISDDAIAAAKRIGPVTVIKEGTACKTPDAAEYIQKSKAKGSLNKKKKTVKC